MRVSSYALEFAGTTDGERCWLHGYNRACDLIHRDVSRQIEEPDTLAAETVTMLASRGYLTERSEQEEGQIVARILDVYRRHLEPRSSFTVVAEGEAPPLDETEIQRLAGLCAQVMGRLSDTRSGNRVMIDLRRQKADYRLAFETAVQADVRDFLLHLVVGERGLEFVADQYKLPRWASVELRTAGRAPQAELSMQLQQIANDPSTQVIWVHDCAGATDEDARGLYETARRVIADSLGLVSFVITGDDRSRKVAPLLFDGSRLYALDEEELVILRNILRYIEGGAISYFPYLLPEQRRFILECSSDVKVIAERGGERFAAGSISEGIEMDFDEAASFFERQKAPFDGCQDCAYSLICDGAYRSSPPPSDARQCAQGFREKLDRVMPSVLFNKLAMFV
jgi:hypothetical protein